MSDDLDPPRDSSDETPPEPSQPDGMGIDGLGLDEPIQPAKKSDGAYRVLARKYRPIDFSELIGQEALVRTLTNAIESGRIAQAFMLTGVRGVGKTTTARIIAKALNCIGPDGKGGPTISPCGVCQNCTAITEDRHVDVIEMDAASRTGVDDIRELIDGVRYRPVSARYKVYVLDEVHMLTKNAFNALLKTLEEPPEHVKFIFATTEIRKVPVTVLSRCQRFDLRRVPIDQLAEHFTKVAGQEGIGIDGEAVGMVARAADGSVRDGLSILDRAIALSAGDVTAERVRDMLGLADRGRLFDLFDAILGGKAQEALTALEDLYDTGADPIVVIEDLLEITHFLTRSKLTPDIFDRPTTPELERTRGKEMAQAVGIPVLARAWQMLLKGLGEVRSAPAPIQAAEMVIIRLLHVADSLPPGELLAKLKDAPAGGGGGYGGNSGSNFGGSPGGGVRAAVGGGAGGGLAPNLVHSAPVSQPSQAARSETAPAMPMPGTFATLVKLFEEHRAGILATHLKRDIHLVKFEPGRLEFRPGRNAPRGLHGEIGAKLTEWTGTRWMVSISKEEGDATLYDQEQAKEADKRGRAENDPLVQSVLQAFPGAKITKVTGPDIPEDKGFEDPDPTLMDPPDALGIDPDDDEIDPFN